MADRVLATRHLRVVAALVVCIWAGSISKQLALHSFAENLKTNFFGKTERQSYQNLRCSSAHGSLVSHTAVQFELQPVMADSEYDIRHARGAVGHVV